MNRLQKAALLVSLVDEMAARGSWCGETHIQKATYFLQELLEVPTDFQFILYKHGPFSFDLRDELTALRADGLVDLQAKLPPYGPSFVSTDFGKRLREHYPKTLTRYGDRVSFVAEHLGQKRVGELERLATALYVMKSDPAATLYKMAAKINELKPHVSVESAKDALAQLQTVLASATARFGPELMTIPGAVDRLPPAP